MVSASANYIEGILDRVLGILEQVNVTEYDQNPDRLMLNISAVYGKYQIRISEILDVVGRKYAYYVLFKDEIVAGFDNSPDALALRLKYGAGAKQFRHVRIPHCHLNNKTRIILTDEITCDDFLNWLEHHLSSSDALIV